MTVAAERTTTLYRAFDEGGHLLYIGIAANWARRWAQHSERSPWFKHVARLSIEAHPTRAAALKAERTAIQQEHPIHNIEHTNKDRRPAYWRATGTTELHARDFDHARHATSPEYVAAYKAIDELANSTIDLDGQESLVALVADMARSVPYGDSCDTCDRVVYPVVAKVHGASIAGAYQCCGHVWPCWWSIDSALHR